jgi:hypothetical protein
MLRLDNLWPGRTLRWKAEDHRMGRSGSEMWKADTSRVVALACVSWGPMGCPREQVLNVPITCQRYGPYKPSSRPSTEGWLCPHCFNDCLGWETGYRPTDRSADVLWIMSGALFLWSSDPVQLCWWLCGRLLCVDCIKYIWSRTIRGLSMGCMWHVGQVFLQGVQWFKSPRLSDMSNRLFVAVSM